MENQTKQDHQAPVGPSKNEAEDGKAMAILAYIGILALIPFFAEKKNKFVRYHAVAGMNLLLIWIAYSIIYGIVMGIVSAATVGSCVNSVYTAGYYGGYGASCAAGFGAIGVVGLIFGLIGLFFFVLAIMGIVNAATGKTKELPVIGKLKIFKK